ncbi:MAG: hypothetical protein P8Y66_08185 [Nitrospirota bacterium]|jgi:hypothetical protein
MKRFLIAVLFILLLAGFSWAQMGPGGQGMMQGAQEQQESPGYGHGYGPGWGMMGPGWGCQGPGYGMGPGMMGPGWGYGMGPGMMGPGYGYGMGPGMMGPGYGYGMGPGMMGPSYGYGMRPGWGYGMASCMGPCWGNWGSEECRNFLDKTQTARKNLHMRMFDYMEAMRNPKTKPEELEKLRNEMWNLRQEICKESQGAGK